MYLLTICDNPEILKVLRIIKILIKFMEIIVPALLILMGCINYVKALWSSDENALKEANKSMVKKVVSAVLVFLIPTVLTIVVDTFGILLPDYKACFGNISEEDIRYAYENKAEELVLKAEQEITYSSYNEAKSYLKNVDDNTLKVDYENRLDIVYKKIKESEGINAIEDIFNSSITYSYEYVQKNGDVSYALYTPSTVNDYEKLPLIIWLHGSGSLGISKEDFRDSGLIGIVDDWKLDNFNAYILCPHITESSDYWGSVNVKTEFNEIFNEILTTKKIDRNKIVLSGHSLGGQGVLYIADGQSSNFSAFAVMSGYDSNTDLSQYKNIPIKGYVGTTDAGESSRSYNYMLEKFSNNFGKENVIVLDVSHGRVPKTAFNIDKNKDNKSDLIMWMLSQ